MKPIYNLTVDQEQRVAELAKAFDQSLQNGKQGVIENEDAFEKKGLFQQLQECENFRADYIQRAVKKVGCPPA